MGYSPTKATKRMGRNPPGLHAENRRLITVGASRIGGNMPDYPNRAVELPLKSQAEREFGILGKLWGMWGGDCPRGPFFTIASQ